MKRILLLLISTVLINFFNIYGMKTDTIQMLGLMDIRTDYSDGAHTLDYIVKLAKKRGFHVLFITDHDRVALEYGLLPFENILKIKVERDSINKKGALKYLSMIERVSKENPDMILIPGTESSPFYYWKGSIIKRNLTVLNWERHLLVVGLEDPSDYKNLPTIHNESTYNVKRFSYLTLLLLILVSIFCIYIILRKKKAIKIAGIIILIFCLLLMINKYFYKNYSFDQYHGDKGISPYQVFIDYVINHGGMVFWNHPETKSGYSKMGPVYRNTPPYPQVLIKSRNYTGFSSLYGDSTTIIDPGNLWDKVLLEYCSGKRENPVWGISTSDFHKEGGAGEKLGNFLTVFLVTEKSKRGILDAMEKGKMYAFRGNIDYPPLVLKEFSVSNSHDSQNVTMGDEIICDTKPHIHIVIQTAFPKTENAVIVQLIRSGTMIKKFSGKTPLHIDYHDNYYKAGKKTYYRITAKDSKNQKIVSNPVFVTFKKK